MAKAEVLVVFSLLVCYVLSNYDGDKVYRVVPQSDQHLRLLNIIKDGVDGVDFWTHTFVVGVNVDVRVTTSYQGQFLLCMAGFGIKYTTIIENFAKAVEDERLSQAANPRMLKGKISFTKYNTYSEV